MKHSKFPDTWLDPQPEELAGMTAPVAFDLDSVLNEGDYLRDYVAEHLGLSSADIKLVKTSEDHTYEVFHFEVPGVGYKEMGELVNKCIREESPSSLPSPFMAGVTEWVYHMTNQPVMVVTARHPSNVGVTYRWLEEHLTVPFKLIIASSVSKLIILKALETRIYPDDRWKTIQSLRAGGIDTPVMYRRPWNQGRPEPSGVLEIDDLRGIIPLVNIITGINPIAWPHWVPYPKPDGERITKKYATIC